jgi:hypothetical protein
MTSGLLQFGISYERLTTLDICKCPLHGKLACNSVSAYVHRKTQHGEMPTYEYIIATSGIRTRGPRGLVS